MGGWGGGGGGWGGGEGDVRSVNNQRKVCSPCPPHPPFIQNLPTPMFVIGGFQKGDPNIQSNYSTHIRGPQEKIERSGIQGAKSFVGSSGNNIASLSLPL